MQHNIKCYIHESEVPQVEERDNRAEKILEIIVENFILKKDKHLIILQRNSEDFKQNKNKTFMYLDT